MTPVSRLKDKITKDMSTIFGGKVFFINGDEETDQFPECGTGVVLTSITWKCGSENKISIAIEGQVLRAINKRCSKVIGGLLFDVHRQKLGMPKMGIRFDTIEQLDRTHSFLPFYYDLLEVNLEKRDSQLAQEIESFMVDGELITEPEGSQGEENE